MYRTLAALSALALVAACDERTDTVADASPAAAAPAPAADLASAPPTLDATSTTGFVNAMARSDLYEVKAGKLAQERAQAANVKSFGAMMVTDHSATTAQIKAIVQKDKLSAPPAALDPKRQAMIDALDASPAGAFDKLYTDQQVKAHEEALATLEAYAKDGTNADLKAFAAKTAPKVQQHLTMAQSLAKTAGAAAPAAGR